MTSREYDDLKKQIADLTAKVQELLNRPVYMGCGMHNPCCPWQHQHSHHYCTCWCHNSYTWTGTSTSSSNVSSSTTFTVTGCCNCKKG